jgi:hypothetical protein
MIIINPKVNILNIMKIDGVEVIEGDKINIINQPNFIGKKLKKFWYFLYNRKYNNNQNGIYVVTKINKTNDN